TFHFAETGEQFKVPGFARLVKVGTQRVAIGFRCDTCSPSPQLVPRQASQWRGATTLNSSSSVPAVVKESIHEATSRRVMVPRQNHSPVIRAMSLFAILPHGRGFRAILFLFTSVHIRFGRRVKPKTLVLGLLLLSCIAPSRGEVTAETQTVPQANPG